MCYENRNEIDLKFPPETVYGYIYGWKRIKNGKMTMRYVGQTKNLDKREQQHLNGYGSKLLYEVIQNDNGINENDFIRVILDVAYTKDELDTKEIEYIKLFNTFHPNGYNITRGGDSNPMENPEVRKKVSDAMKGKWSGENNPMKKEENRKKISGDNNHMKSEEKRKMRSDAMKGENNPMKNSESRKKVSDAMKGENNPTKRKEVRIKISESMKGKCNAPKKPVRVFKKDTGELVGEFESGRYASRVLGIDQGNMQKVLKGKKKSVKGYIFMYC